MAITMHTFAPNLYLLGMLAVVDRLVLSPVIMRRLGAGKAQRREVSACRWFILHALANAFVCITAVVPLLTTLTDPFNAMDSKIYSDTSMLGKASIWPLAMVNSVHIYHMIGGFMLSSADYFHHCLFVPLLGFPGQVLPWGAVEPAGAFFISGLCADLCGLKPSTCRLPRPICSPDVRARHRPGGVSYFLLGLQKLGLLESIVEKRVTANLNTWVRTPGILFVCFVVYQGMLYGRHTLPLWALVVQSVLPAYNALYYNKQAVANFTVHFLNALLKQDPKARELLERTFELPGNSAMAMAWKEACGVPQRGS